MNRIKKISILFSLIASCAILFSCDDNFLERYPLDRPSDAVFFYKASDLQIYINQYYCMRSFPNYWAFVYSPGGQENEYQGGAEDFNSDIIFDFRSINTRLQGSRNATNSGPWSQTYWYWIRRVNYFFDNYERCEEPFATYQQYVGEAYFFRALYYSRMLQAFGDVPWYSSAMGTASEGLYDPRTPRHIVADNILADLDEAVRLLTANKDNGCSRINKWIALLFQSRIALYEGCWHKYHAGTVFAAQVNNAEKYLNKAAEAAQAVINSGLYDIYTTGKPETDYYDLFTQRTYANNSEVLFWTQFSKTQEVTNNKNYQFSYPRQFGISKKLADSYLCDDGRPISVSDRFAGHKTLTDEATHRDPRFFQTIFTPEAPWTVENDGTVEFYWATFAQRLNDGSNSLESPTGYMRRKEYDARKQYQDAIADEAPHIQFRYAEVLLNFAEAKAELGTLSQNDVDVSIKKLRDRVGMPNLVLANITTDPNWDFPTLSPVINEVRRERLVELACEGFRWNDIARWAAADELINGKRPKGAMGAQFVNQAGIFSMVDAAGFVDCYQNAMPNGWGFVLDRDYLDPIPQSQITLNKNLVQNPNWGWIDEN